MDSRAENRNVLLRRLGTQQRDIFTLASLPIPSYTFKQEDFRNPKQEQPKDLYISELVLDKAGGGKKVESSNSLNQSQEVDEMAVANRVSNPTTALQSGMIRLKSHSIEMKQDLHTGGLHSTGISSKAVRELERKLEKKGILNYLQVLPLLSYSI